MSDTTLTVGGATTISPDTGTAETVTPGQTPGTETAELGEGQTATSEASGEQSTAEGSQEQTGRKRDSSMFRDMTKLRAQNRELRESLSRIEQLQNDFAALREELSRSRPSSGPAKTPANFWQDPEAILDSKLDEKLERMQNTMLENFQTTREQEYERQARAQETASAAEFIRSQPGYDQSDEAELVEIIKEIPNGDALPPGWKAEYAWRELQRQRGVGDRSLAKRQAAGVQGQPPGVGFGRKTWNKTEFDQAVDMVEQKMRQNPNDPKMNELFNELMAAHKEGRVK